MVTLMMADILTVNIAAVADIAATVVMRICIEDFVIATRTADTDAIMLARDRRKVTDDDHFTALFVTAGKGENRVLMIVDHQPFEATGIVIQLI